ncbi:MAG: DUF998 domain-containing protein [Thermomicrobiales bacterium]
MEGLNATTQKVLLGCGVASGALYFVGDILMSARYPGYSLLHRTVSELNALGAPTRGLSIAFGLAGYALLVPFGVGVWRVAAGSRSWRAAGAALFGLGAFGLWGVPFASMQPPGTEQEGLHALSGMVGLLLLVAAMCAVATAPDQRLRLYSLATLVIMIAFSGWAAMQASGVEAGLATPWVGAKERIGFYSWHLWFIVLALMLIRRSVAAGAGRSTRKELPTSVPVATTDAAPVR